MEQFLATVCTGDWNDKQDEGRTIAEAVELLTVRWPQHTALISAYYDRWIEMISGPIDEAVDVLKELHERRFPLFALTNWSAETFPLVRPRYSFFDWFRGIVVSGEEKIKKPDPLIYEVLIERYTIDAERALFIDDKLENVAAAAQIGMQGIQYTSASALRAKLSELGML